MSSPSFVAAQERETSVRSKTRGSLERFVRAQNSLAGGVSTSVRRNARPYPLYFTRGAGSKIVDVDENQYIDFGLAWGPLILGHTPPRIVEAVSAWLLRGATFGAQHELEYEVAEQLCRILPCAGRVVFSNSGTEIVQVALRLARAATGRQRFLKFEGHYHGWDDSVLVSYHPTLEAIAASQSEPISIGLGQRAASGAVIAEWNSRESVERAFAEHGSQISAVLCEPLLCNSGCIPPEPGFLEFLREITLRHGALLIFDEVITGFRLALDGAQGFYGVTPDLATYAKAAAGGLPLSVLAGSSQYMDLIADGKVVHAGTLNGNPLSLAAAQATLRVLSEGGPSLYARLWQVGERLREGLMAVLGNAGRTVVTSGGGPVFQLSFMRRPARNYRDTLAADTAQYSDFVLALLDEGILALPDGRWYLSTAHTEQDVEQTLAAAARAV